MLDHDSKAELNRRLVKGDITPEEYDRIVERIGVDTVQQPEPPPFIGPGERLVPVAPELNNRPKNYFVRLWRGYISLPSTYWLWGSLGSGLAGLAAGGVLMFCDTEAEAVAVVAILLAYTLFTIVCIWRSANRYKLKKSGKAYWGRLAQVACVLGLLSGSWKIVTLIPGIETDEAMDELLAKESAGTPSMISSNIRFDTVTRNERTFTYHYTVIGPSHVPDATDQQSVEQGLVNALCASRAGRHLLLRLDKATYTYVNEQGETLERYDVARRDCR